MFSNDLFNLNKIGNNFNSFNFIKVSFFFSSRFFLLILQFQFQTDIENQMKQLLQLKAEHSYLQNNLNIFNEMIEQLRDSIV